MQKGRHFRQRGQLPHERAGSERGHFHRGDRSGSSGRRSDCRGEKGGGAGGKGSPASGGEGSADQQGDDADRDPDAEGRGAGNRPDRAEDFQSGGGGSAGQSGAVRGGAFCAGGIRSLGHAGVQGAGRGLLRRLLGGGLRRMQGGRSGERDGFRRGDDLLGAVRGRVLCPPCLGSPDQHAALFDGILRRKADRRHPRLGRAGDHILLRRGPELERDDRRRQPGLLLQDDPGF